MNCNNKDQKNDKYNENEDVVDILTKQYKQVPMSLTLEKFYNIGDHLNSKNEDIKDISAAKPLSIPGTSSYKNHKNKFAHTFPLFQQSHIQNNSSKFIVGSVRQEKSPIPWPNSFLRSDSNYQHLKNIRNEVWPPNAQDSINNENDIFAMDEDFQIEHSHCLDDDAFDDDVEINEDDLYK